MKKIRPILGIMLVIVLFAGVFVTYLAFQNWTIRFSDELDRFFGEGNWE